MSVPQQASAASAAAGGVVVVDASVVVDLLAGTEFAPAAAARLRGSTLHAPAHFPAEVFSALARLHRGDNLTVDDVERALEALAAMPVIGHPVAGLLPGAWHRRGRLRVLDALYVELASQLDTVVVTTDHRLAHGSDRAEAIAGDGPP